MANLLDGKKDWRIEIDSRNSRNTKVFYKGEPVGLLSSLDFSVDSGSNLPKVTFGTYMARVEIVTVDNGEVEEVATNVE